MKKIKLITIFDSTDYSERYNETRDYLFASRSNDFDWETSDDVPIDMIHDEMNFQEEIEYQYFKDKLEFLLQNRNCIISGVCGRWNEPKGCGRFIQTFGDLSSFLQHLDSLKITDQNGHLIIEGYHHDGHDRYELKCLTNKGYEYADRNYFAHSKELHDKIMNCNFFSALPHLAAI